MIEVKSAGITDVGRKRKANEDSLFLDDDMKLYLVADGMGGHNAGEVASRLVVEAIQDYMKLNKEETSQDEVAGFDQTLSSEANRLNLSIHLANQVVYESSKRNESYRGMGSTVSGVYFTDKTLIAANVGDSPIYLIRSGTINTLSVPHTLMAEFDAASDGNKILDDKYRHIITRAMGIKETVKPDISEIKPFKGDILVISSDGLSDKVSPEEILVVASKTKPGKACRLLVNQANKRGGDDNITVIVLKITDVKTVDFQNGLKGDKKKSSKETSMEKAVIAVDYDTEDDSYHSFVSDLNVDGVFIETMAPFSIGQELTLTFSFLNEPDSCTVKGEIANRKPKGIEVQFKNLNQHQIDMIRTFKKKL